MGIQATVIFMVGSVRMSNGFVVGIVWLLLLTRRVLSLGFFSASGE